MGAEYKVHTKLLTEFETLGVMGENCSGIIKPWYVIYQFSVFFPTKTMEIIKINLGHYV